MLTSTQTESKTATEARILAYIEKLNRELIEYAGDFGSLVEIEADLKGARARLKAIRS
ncbi:MAG: hypothetical protein HC924_17800 [Synechococcaceae cyanobacterium SM2_3_2]|nr:hypothetical protein [Synechococcaceae cyanobacterium SM2_3_2]